MTIQKKSTMVTILAVIIALLTSFVTLGSVEVNAASVNYDWPLKVSNPSKYITDVVCHKSETEKWLPYNPNGKWPHTNNAHFGLDFGVAKGTKVYASEAGKVTVSGNVPGYGKTIIIKHSNGQYSLYAHLSSLSVKKGKKVKKGQLIGKSGDTGNVTGNCLHFGIYKVNPLPLRETGLTKNQVYKRVVDPLQYLNTTKHKIYYSTEGGEGSYSTLNLKYGTQFKVPAKAPTKAGYTFSGWKLKRLKDSKWYVTGKGWCTEDSIEKKGYSPRLYPAGKTLTIDVSWIEGSSNSNYRFYAVWKKNTASAPKNITITFGLNEGSGYFSDQTVPYGNLFTVPSAIPTKAGYRFKGWYLKRVDDNVWYISGHGWMNWDKAKSSGYTPRIYEPGRELRIDDSWTSGTSKSNFRFYAQWE